MKKDLFLIPSPNSESIYGLNYSTIKRVEVAEDTAKYSIVNLYATLWYGVINNVFFEAKVYCDKNGYTLVPGKRCVFEKAGRFGFEEVRRAYESTRPRTLCMDCVIQYKPSDARYHITEQKDINPENSVYLPAEEIWDNPYKLVVPNLAEDAKSLNECHFRYKKYFADNGIYSRHSEERRAAVMAYKFGYGPFFELEMNRRTLSVSVFKDMNLNWDRRFGGIVGGNGTLKMRFKYASSRDMNDFANLIGI